MFCISCFFHQDVPYISKNILKYIGVNEYIWLYDLTKAFSDVVQITILIEHTVQPTKLSRLHIGHYKIPCAYHNNTPYLAAVPPQNLNNITQMQKQSISVELTKAHQGVQNVLN